MMSRTLNPDAALGGEAHSSDHHATEGAATARQDRIHSDAFSGPSRSRNASRWRTVSRWVIACAILALAGLFLVMQPALPRRIARFAQGVLHQILPSPEKESVIEGASKSPHPRWNDGVILEPDHVQAIGITTWEVRELTEPLRIECTARTAFNLDRQARIRSLFTGIVDRAYVELGQYVRKGDKLVDLFSVELASAKGDYEKKRAQHEYDTAQLIRARALHDTANPSISEKQYQDAVRAEKISATEEKIAYDALLVYGLTAEDIQKSIDETGRQKAMITFRSPIDGVVIRRDMVPGNLYQIDDILVVVAPVEHLWVWGNIYPSDAHRVEIGQEWVITMPYTADEFHTRIEAISHEVDPETRTVQIRTQIPNPDGRIKADMLVRGYIAIPPQANQTVVPRQSMVTAGGRTYVFVQAEDELKYERREIRVARESHDEVIVATGLEPGQRVVVQGSLVLAQLDESLRVAATGTSNP
jgi:cobalt-zinc-cadmium efflux system membrane fusion protein